MKYRIAIFLFVFACAIGAQADQAVLSIRIGKEKQLRRVVIDLFEGDAPQTVENFKKLSRKGFYKKVKIHRVFPGLLVQMGDPLSKKKDRRKVGTGGPGYTLPPEISRKHTAGAVAMTRLPDEINPGRLSNGSQFYICLKPMPNLDGNYTVFGQVVEGLEALDEISRKPVDTNDNPIDRIEIRSVKITATGT
jgi:peptidyl-prolyl cis-trans isomerase B (cyclophilin B)